MVLHVWAGPSSNKTRHTDDVPVGIRRGLYATASRIIHVWLIHIDQVPVRGTYIVALVLQGRLTEHDTDRVLAELLVIGQRVLNLPGCAVGFLRRGLGVVGVVVTREIVLLGSGRLTAPERLFGTPGEMVLQVIPQLQVDGELRHELMRPTL